MKEFIYRWFHWPSRAYKVWSAKQRRRKKKYHSASSVQRSQGNPPNSKHTTTTHKSSFACQHREHIQSILRPNPEISSKSPCPMNRGLPTGTSGPSHCLLSAPCFWEKQQRLTVRVCWSWWTKQQANLSIFNFFSQTLLRNWWPSFNLSLIWNISAITTQSLQNFKLGSSKECKDFKLQCIISCQGRSKRRERYRRGKKKECAKLGVIREQK